MTVGRSPYAGKHKLEWEATTRALVDAHPLKLHDIRDAVLESWDLLWKTAIGAPPKQIPLTDVEVPATVVGYFLERLLALHLETRFPGQWRAPRSKEEKDLVYVPDNRYSTEVKSSGQRGYHIYGNRSYGQKPTRRSQAKKEKSGYYVTVNFHDHTITLIRFGWIDATDWKPQDAPTGQMAGLEDAVYEFKLIDIPGAYRLAAPVGLLKGIGASKEAELNKKGIVTTGDLRAYTGSLPPLFDALREEVKRWPV